MRLSLRVMVTPPLMVVLAPAVTGKFSAAPLPLLSKTSFAPDNPKERVKGKYGGVGSPMLRLPKVMVFVEAEARLMVYAPVKSALIDAESPGALGTTPFSQLVPDDHAVGEPRMFVQVPDAAWLEKPAIRRQKLRKIVFTAAGNELRALFIFE